MTTSMQVDLTVVLGTTEMPLRRLLRINRGATIGLDSLGSDIVEIRANGHPIAHGTVKVANSGFAVEITDIIRKPEVLRETGITIGRVLNLAAGMAAPSTN